MITHSPYKLEHITKPGYGDPKPMGPPRTIDPPEDVEKCQNCPVPPEKCRGQCEPGEMPKEMKKIQAVQMIRSGAQDWWIMRELGISRYVLEKAREMMK